MKKIKSKILVTLFIYVVLEILIQNSVFAKTTIEIAPNTTKWNKISVSNAFDACRNLKENYSSLGENNLDPHLSTNADWYAVSVLTFSSYGSKTAANTTGNSSGIMNFGTTQVQTAGLMEGYNANSTYLTSLVNNINTEYVELLKIGDEKENNELGRGLLDKEHLASLGEIQYGNSVNLPVCMRYNLFGVIVGAWGSQANSTANGKEYNEVTFRPVIWNK